MSTSSPSALVRAAGVLLVAAVALAASLVPLQSAPERIRGGLGRFGDTPLYLRLAYNLSAGRGFSGTDDEGWRGTPVPSAAPFLPCVARGPVYPAFLSGVQWLVGTRPALRTAETWPRDWHRFRIAQCVLHALTSLLVVAIVRTLWPAAFGPAILAGLLQALGVYSLYYTRELLSETLTAFLLTLAILFTVRAMSRRRVLEWIAAGATFGVVVLARPEYVAVPLLLALYAAWVRRRGGRVWRDALALVLAAACVVAPWTLRNLRVTGRFVPVAAGGLGSNLYTGSFETPATWRGWGAFPESIFFLPDERERLTVAHEGHLDAMSEGGPAILRADSVFRALALDRIRARPAQALGVWLGKVPRLWYQDYIPMYGKREASGVWFLLYLAAAVAAFVLAPPERRASLGVIAALFVYLNLVFLPVHVEPRYGVALMPAILAVAGVGLGALRERFARRGAPLTRAA